MDEKTAELRDIFVEATGSETVTERQAEARGSLADAGGEDVAGVRELVERMRERYEFETDLDDDALVRVVRTFHAEGTEAGEAAAANATDVSGEDDGGGGGDGDGATDAADAADASEALADEDLDAALADALGVDPETAFAARMDLHLVRPADRDAPVPYDELRRRVVDGDADADVAAALGTDEDVVAHYRRVVEADLASTRANDRFRDGFEDRLTDSGLSASHARDAREDGLREATEDIETDVSL
jgi:hypothetical protein